MTETVVKHKYDIGDEVYYLMPRIKKVYFSTIRGFAYEKVAFKGTPVKENNSYIIEGEYGFCPEGFIHDSEEAALTALKEQE